MTSITDINTQETDLLIPIEEVSKEELMKKYPEYKAGYEAGFADAEVNKASCCVANEEAITELTRKIEVAKKALEDLRTGIYHTSRVTSICEAALKEIE